MQLQQLQMTHALFVGRMDARCLAFYRSTDKTRDLMTRFLRSCANHGGKNRAYMLGCDDQTVMNKMYVENLRMKSKWKIFDFTSTGERVQITSRINDININNKKKKLYFPNRVGVSPVTGVKVMIWNTTLTPRGTFAWDCTAVDRREIWVAMPQAPKLIEAKIRAVQSYAKFLIRCNRYV